MDSVRFTNAFLTRLATATRTTPPPPVAAEGPKDVVELGERLAAGLRQAGGLAACLASAAGGGPIALVAAMEAAEAVVEPAQERAMGENVYRFYSGRGVVAEDPAAQAALEGVARPVLAGSTADVQVHLIEGEELNASASFGGFLYASRGLLASSPSVQAFVLGHEAAHIEARHDLKRQGMSTLAKLVGNSDPELAQGLREASLEVQRDFERHADRRGLEIALAAGADGAEIVAEVHGWEGADEVHPPAEERADALRSYLR